MGIEYFINIFDPNMKLIDNTLRSLPFFREVYQLDDKIHYVFRLKADNKEMPNAEVVIEENGLYFCDYGSSKEIINLLINKIRQYYVDAKIKELE